MILEKFFTDKYDNEILFVDRNVKFKEFKDYVYAQKKIFESSKTLDTALLCENYFEFAINFFASIFANKQINLITDKSRLSLLKKDYILPKMPEKSEWEIFENTFNPQKIMVNLFTSGSTGTPKTIGKTLYNLEQEAQTTLDEFTFDKDIIICSTTLSSHSYGVAFNFILPFYAGFKINQTKIEFPEQFPQKGKYVLISTPSFMEKLEKYDYKFSNPPAIIFLAGAKLKDETFKYLSRFSTVIDIYGSTETGNIAYKQGGNVFNVLKNVEISTEVEGKILVQSDFFPEKEMVLNDIIEKLSDETFTLKKRTDRIVKIQEKRISLTEIENYLKNFPDIKDTCCFQDGDRLNCAVTTFNYELESSELKKYLSNFVEITPKKWRILEEIPRNATGKIDYEKLRKIFSLNLSLPFILEKNMNNSTCEIKMRFKKTSNFFKGHFDIKPILPGVVQLFFAKYYAEDIFKISLQSGSVKKVKFSNIITPDETITIRLVNKDASVEFTYLTDDKIYSSGIFIK